MKRGAFTGLKHGEERGLQTSARLKLLSLSRSLLFHFTHEVRGQRSHQQDDTNKESLKSDGINQIILGSRNDRRNKNKFLQQR